MLNRIVSVIDAIRDGRKQDRSFDDSFSERGRLHFKFDVDPFVNQGQVSFVIFSRL